MYDDNMYDNLEIYYLEEFERCKYEQEQLDILDEALEVEIFLAEQERKDESWRDMNASARKKAAGLYDNEWRQASRKRGRKSALHDDGRDHKPYTLK